MDREKSKRGARTGKTAGALGGPVKDRQDEPLVKGGRQRTCSPSGRHPPTLRWTLDNRPRTQTRQVIGISTADPKASKIQVFLLSLTAFSSMFDHCLTGVF